MLTREQLAERILGIVSYLQSRNRFTLDALFGVYITLLSDEHVHQKDAKELIVAQIGRVF